MEQMLGEHGLVQGPAKDVRKLEQCGDVAVMFMFMFM